MKLVKIKNIFLILMFALFSVSLLVSSLKAEENSAEIINVDDSAIEPLISFQDDIILKTEEIDIEPKSEDKEILKINDADNEFDFSDELNTTLFDVYLGDRLIGLSVVDFTETSMQIPEIDALLDQLKDCVKDVNSIRPLLEGVIKTERNIPEIGSIKFDIYTFHVELNINPDLVINSQSFDGINLPDPANDFSFQHRMGVNASGSFGHDHNNTSFNHRTMASVGRWFATIEGTLIDDDEKDDEFNDPYQEVDDIFKRKKDDNYDLTEADVGVTLGNYQMGFGANRTDGEIFAGSTDYMGFYFKTSEETFLDRDKLHGSRLTIFVPSRSRVEFFQGSRLISTQMLNYGVQDVDTTNFPHGSYDVDIVIHQDNGTVIRDRQFFTKSGHLTIRAHPIITLRGGVLRDNFDTFSDTKVYQASTRIRTLSFLENEFSIQGVDNIHIGSIGFRSLLGVYSIDGKYLLSSEHDHGYYAAISGQTLGLDWYATHSKTSGKKIDSGTELKSNKSMEIDDFNALGIYRSTSSGSIGKTFNALTLRFRATRNEYGTKEDYAYGPEARYEIIRGYKNNLYATVSFTKTDEKDQIFGGLYYTLRLDDQPTIPQHTLTMNLTGQSRGGDSLEILRTNYEYNNRDATNKGLRLQLQNELNNRRGDKDKVYTNNEVRMDYADEFVDTTSFINNRYGSEDDKTSYGINADTSFIIDKSLVPKVAFPFMDQAALEVVIDSDNSGEKVDIFVNGVLRTTVAAGKRTIIGLAPYESYTVSIRPKEQNEFVLYDSSERRFTLFPGNIVLEEWKISKMYIGIGRLVDTDGNPMKWKHIKGTSGYTYSEEDGSFQAELTGDEKPYVESNGKKCFLQIPEVKSPKFTADLGDVICK